MNSGIGGGFRGEQGTADPKKPTPDSPLSPELKAFYDSILIERALPNLLHLQFGTVKRPDFAEGKC